MLMQFGLREWEHFDTMAAEFPGVLGMSGPVSLGVMIAIETVCSLFIMAGCLTRLMCIPPFLSMVVAEWYLLSTAQSEPWQLTWAEPGYVPVLFMGIYFFILLVGPGKISCDYFLSLHFIHSDNQSESELEEV